MPSAKNNNAADDQKNGKTTRRLRRPLPLKPADSLPVNTSIGLKEDRKKAG